MKLVSFDRLKNYSKLRKTEISISLLDVIQNHFEILSADEMTWIFKILAIISDEAEIKHEIGNKILKMLITFLNVEKNDVEDGLQLTYSKIVQNMLESCSRITIPQEMTKLQKYYQIRLALTAIHNRTESEFPAGFIEKGRW
jgi:hypothetical protein